MVEERGYMITRYPIFLFLKLVFFSHWPVWAKLTHPCGPTCLGPLTFHPGAVGKKVTLSHGNCRASRDLETFHDGLVFSSRPVKREEQVQIKVERSLSAWQGAVRVGFTNVCPTTRPLPPLAIPDLTDRPGYCARPVPHSYCPPGTTITFWMTRKGHMGYKTSTGMCKNTKTDLDVTLPLWALIDVYGQSTTVLLLGEFTDGVHWCHFYLIGQL